MPTPNPSEVPQLTYSVEAFITLVVRIEWTAMEAERLNEVRGRFAEYPWHRVVRIDGRQLPWAAMVLAAGSGLHVLDQAGERCCRRTYFTIVWRMTLWAHSVSDVSGVRHSLHEHCRSTGEWAGRFASVFGAGDLAHALGLFHDAGKASCLWQSRLLEVEASGTRVGVPHKELGARLLYPVADVAAMAVWGHHGGLLSSQMFDDLLAAGPAPGDADAAAEFFDAVPEAKAVLDGAGLIPSSWQGAGNELVMEMGLRMAFSTLVDADHLDTGAHRRGLAGPKVAEPTDMAMLADRFEQRRTAKIARKRNLAGGPTATDLLRTQVYAAAVAAAKWEPGVFRLAAPTGLGKTFAQGAFGLEHAKAWGKSRVIIAVPFVTITEQNADVYRELLDTDEQPVVLEHHSSVRFEPDNNGTGTVTQAQRWARLAAENWDAPFVVTTTVQLFQSLFGRKPSQVRKLHRLANAVLILDEVQALPPRLLLPILSGLRTLTEHFGTTVLLTSATQPQFQSLSVWRESESSRERLEIKEIISDPQSLFDRARRVRYQRRLDSKVTWEQVAAEVAEQHQALVIVNSVADARSLYRLVSERHQHVWHLSTRMCPQHRRDVLRLVGERLARGLPTLVVSTQLIEAGVDVSFPAVWRALAPADSVQQAGGRANRNGEYPEGGLVVVFDPVDGKRPPDYEIGCGLTAIHFGSTGAELDDQDMLARYYQELYEQLRLDYRPMNRSKWNVGQVIQDSRRKLDYIAVTDGPEIDLGVSAGRDRKKAFRMIDEDTVPVVIDDARHRPMIEATLADLAAGRVGSSAGLRTLQPWIVQLPTHRAQRPETAALIDPIVGDLGRWKGTYDWDSGTGRGLGIDEDDLPTVF
ncbi:CRISPR-associated helicase Cas3' [Nocardia nepalensis]|uniref:CRISPR-associated helicase Cas3' n=1 Tax=Nocardia nepalensis TaxID=3375448 RepID=UPI003B66B3B4